MTSMIPKALVAPWPVFGVDGRSTAEIESAIGAGYRRFDTAESYGSAPNLVQALKNTSLSRDEYELLYKFDIHPNETGKDLNRRLRENAENNYGGRFDRLVIHNPEDEMGLRTPEALWQTLAELKNDGIAHAIGVGNVTSRHQTVVEKLTRIHPVEIVENALDSLLDDDDLQAMIRRTKAHVYYYGVQSTAKEIGLAEAAELRAMFYKVHVLYQPQDVKEPSYSNAIISSGNTEHQTKNLKEFNSDPAVDDYENTINFQAFEKITTWTKKKSTVQYNDDNFSISKELRNWLSINCFEPDVLKARTAIEESAKPGVADQDDIVRWIEQSGVLRKDLDTVRVPARTTLKSKYLGWRLGDILVALFGSATCNWKWSIELVQLMLASVDEWEKTKSGFSEIVQL